MKIGGPRFFQRSVLLAAACILAVVLTACTGRGGGYLPPQSPVFTGQAAFGFTFSCQNGDLKIELAYNDKGSNPIGSSFGIHGIVDRVDPVLESADLHWRESASPAGEPADLLGPLPADLIGAIGLSIDVPKARDVDLAAMPLRGHRAGQRPESELRHRVTSSRSSCRAYCRSDGSQQSNSPPEPCSTLGQAS